MYETFEIRLAIAGPENTRGAHLGHPQRLSKWSAETPQEAREFCRKLCDGLLTEDNFKFARIAYVRDLKTGRFV